MDSAGAVAAPLLAGFALALLVLVLPELSEKTAKLTLIDGQTGTITGPPGFSGAPDVAAAFLLLAGSLLIGSTQAAIFTRKYGMTPSEMRDWYPQQFLESEEWGELPPWVPPSFLEFGKPGDRWGYRGWGKSWYGAWVRRKMAGQIEESRKWAHWTRRLYNLGVLALLAGITALVWPPSGQWSVARIVLLALAGLSTFGELLWQAWHDVAWVVRQVAKAVVRLLKHVAKAVVWLLKKVVWLLKKVAHAGDGVVHEVSDFAKQRALRRSDRPNRHVPPPPPAPNGETAETNEADATPETKR